MKITVSAVLFQIFWKVICVTAIGSNLLKFMFTEYGIQPTPPGNASVLMSSNVHDSGSVALFVMSPFIEITDPVLSRISYHFGLFSLNVNVVEFHSNVAFVKFNFSIVHTSGSKSNGDNMKYPNVMITATTTHTNRDAIIFPIAFVVLLFKCARLLFPCFGKSWKFDCLISNAEG